MWNSDAAIGADMADMNEGFAPDLRIADLLRTQCLLRLTSKRLNRCIKCVCIKRQAKRCFTQNAPIRQSHAVSRKHAAKRVDYHALHRQRIGDEAGMLSTSPAKTGERIARHIMPARDRDFLDRIGHIGDRNRDEAFGGLFGRDCLSSRCFDFGNERGEFLRNHRIIKR